MCDLGHFGWENFSECSLPYIFREVNGEHFRYISIYHAELLLLSKYLGNIHPDIIYECTLVNGLHISPTEAILLTDITLNHCEKTYTFEAGKDCIALVDEILMFYDFILVCSIKLRCIPGSIDIFGFIRFHTAESIMVVPYIVIDEKKYVPLIFFENISRKLIYPKNAIVKLDNLNLAYFKFCCMIQGIEKRLYKSSSYKAIIFDVVKEYSPTRTFFEYNYWPIKINSKLEPVNQKTKGACTWIKVTPTPTHGMVLRNSTRNRIRKYKQMVRIKKYLIYLLLFILYYKILFTFLISYT